MVNLDPLSQTFFFADDSIVFAKSDLRSVKALNLRFTILPREHIRYKPSSSCKETSIWTVGSTFQIEVSIVCKEMLVCS